MTATEIGGKEKRGLAGGIEEEGEMERVSLKGEGGWLKGGGG